ncbi:unnamed protein product [Rhizophagus irregularis]|nr:unnamed protein product [Rhizophagus irregularis]
MLNNSLFTNSFFINGSKKFQLRSFSSTGYNIISSRVEKRLAVLNKIYSPLMIYHKEKLDWAKLIRSGKVWENYFGPFEWREKDYEFRSKYADVLKEIDAFKDSKKVTAANFLQSMTASFTQQSCALEGNKLGIIDTQKIWNSLKKNYNFDNIMTNWNIPLPAPSSLSDKEENEVIEIRNHLIATYYLYNTLYVTKKKIDFDEIKRIHQILLKGTPMENVQLNDYDFCEDKFQREFILHSGKFRKLSVDSCISNDVIHPFPIEVPALMRSLLLFINYGIPDKIHPIMFACRILSAFHHIHPFSTANGHVGRLIMALYLIRNDYPPVIFHQINQEEYNSTLLMSQVEMDSTSLYALAVVNILNNFIKMHTT